MRHWHKCRRWWQKRLECPFIPNEEEHERIEDQLEDPRIKRGARAVFEESKRQALVPEKKEVVVKKKEPVRVVTDKKEVPKEKVGEISVGRGEEELALDAVSKEALVDETAFEIPEFDFVLPPPGRRGVFRPVNAGSGTQVPPALITPQLFSQPSRVPQIIRGQSAPGQAIPQVAQHAIEMAERTFASEFMPPAPATRSTRSAPFAGLAEVAAAAAMAKAVQQMMKLRKVLKNKPPAPKFPVSKYGQGLPPGPPPTRRRSSTGKKAVRTGKVQGGGFFFNASKDIKQLVGVGR